MFLSKLFLSTFCLILFKVGWVLKFGGKIFQSKTAEKSETLTLPSFGRGDWDNQESLEPQMERGQETKKLEIATFPKFFSTNGSWS